jgi:hypothetical protein
MIPARWILLTLVFVALSPLSLTVVLVWSAVRQGRAV